MIREHRYNSNKRNMKKSITLVYTLLILMGVSASAQSFSEEKIALTNLVKRIYNNQPFDGVKIVDDYDKQYIVSVIALSKEKYKDESTLNRVAQVKTQSAASTFLNGANITMDMIINSHESTDENGKMNTIVETIENIRQDSRGFSQGLELLSSFDNPDGSRTVFIFARELEN